MEKRRLKLTSDHTAKLAKASPLEALEELIWNGLDAGGPSVEVTLTTGELGQLQTITVRDHGVGMPFSELDTTFGELGNSLKPLAGVNGDNRRLVGFEGRGRLKALSLCRRPVWKTTYRYNGKFRRYSVAVNAAEPDFFEPSEEEILDTAETGTTVELDYVEDAADSLTRHQTRDRLTQRFALYLSEYPGTIINLNGEPLSVERQIAKTKTRSVPLLGDPAATVTIIEWRFTVDGRKLHLCTPQGSSLHDLPLKLHAVGRQYTAYFRSSKVQEWKDANLLSVTDLEPSVTQALEAVKDVIRADNREAASEDAAEVVADWKERKVYPYRDGEENSPVVAAEQQVFNAIAVQVYSLHPTFSNADPENTRLILMLIRRALEGNPTTLLPVLKSVVELPEEEQAELADLLQRTTLSSIIKAAKVVTQRLDTIRSFEEIVYDENWKRKLLERTQLHRLLMRELWLFGEQFDLATDDENLHALLKKHCEILKRPQPAPDVEVKTIQGKEGIPDLMLWHRAKVDREMFEHLVIELKRPRDPLGADELTQIKTYAFTVRDDERFDTQKVRWRFVLIGNEFDKFAKTEMSQDSLHPGRIYNSSNLSVWAFKWADIFSDARARYEFFREKLDVQAKAAEGFSRWNEQFSHILNGRGVRKGKDHEICPPESQRKADNTIGQPAPMADIENTAKRLPKKNSARRRR